MSASEHTSPEQFPVMYHATRHPLTGDTVHPLGPPGGATTPRAWASTNPEESARHAHRVGLINGKDYPVRTYQVEPLSSKGLEKGATNFTDKPGHNNYSTSEGFRVLQEVPTQMTENVGARETRNRMISINDNYTFPNFDFSTDHPNNVSSDYLQNTRYNTNPDIDDALQSIEKPSRVFEDKKLMIDPESPQPKSRRSLRSEGMYYARSVSEVKKALQPTELFTTMPLQKKIK